MKILSRNNVPYLVAGVVIAVVLIGNGIWAGDRTPEPAGVFSAPDAKMQAEYAALQAHVEGEMATLRALQDKVRAADARASDAARLVETSTTPEHRATALVEFDWASQELRAALAHLNAGIDAIGNSQTEAKQ